MSVGGHIGFMQITKIAQRVHKGNKVEMVLGPLRNTNQQKNVIGKNISRYPKSQIDYLILCSRAEKNQFFQVIT